MIRLEHVSKSYNKHSKPALDDVHLVIEQGEFVFLIGSSGSGKSTFIKLLLREEVASSGTVWVNGKDVAHIGPWKIPQLRRGMGVVFQDFRLLPTKTVRQNVAFAMEVTGRPRRLIRERVPAVLEMVGLGGKDDRMPHQLSGGEQQRVALARALVNRPGILLCDEPTGNLDPDTSLEIVQILDQINRSTETTVVMATHDQTIVDSVRRRVVELDHGALVRDEATGVYGLTR